MIRYFVGALAFMFTVAAQAQAPLGIGTSPQGTLTYRLGSSYAKAVETASPFSARVQPNSGTGVMVPLVNLGDLALGFVNTLEIDQAYHGTGVFEGRPHKDLRMISVLFPIRVGIFVRDNSDIKTIADLKGKRLPHGYTSQKIIQTLSNAVLANGGLTENDVEQVLVPNLVRGVDEFVAGNVDAAFFAIGTGKVAEAAAAVRGGIRFLPLGEGADAVKAMQAVAGPTYIDTVQEANSLPGVQGSLPAMHYDYVLFANKRVPKATVSVLTGLLLDQQKMLGAGFPLFGQLKQERMHQASLGVPYHDGALQYYEDNDLISHR